MLYSNAPRPLQAVVQSYPQTKTYLDGTRGVSIANLSKAVFTRYRLPRGTSGSYVMTEVLPSLLSRGLFRHVAEKRLFESSTERHWEITDLGMTKLAELNKLLEIGRGPFREWITSDPAKARAFVEIAGPALILLGDLSKEIRQLIGIPDTRERREPPQPDPTPTGKEREMPWLPFGLGAIVLTDWEGFYGAGALDEAGDAVSAIGTEIDQALDTVESAVDEAWDAVTSSDGDGGGE
jgi:hypothetical protein